MFPVGTVRRPASAAAPTSSSARPTPPRGATPFVRPPSARQRGSGGRPPESDDVLLNDAEAAFLADVVGDADGP